jgi:hypothetical protein
MNDGSAITNRSGLSAPPFNVLALLRQVSPAYDMTSNGSENRHRILL